MNSKLLVTVTDLITQWLTMNSITVTLSLCQTATVTLTLTVTEQQCNSESVTEWQCGRLSEWQCDSVIDCQRDCDSARVTKWQSDSEVDCQNNSVTEWQCDRLSEWLCDSDSVKQLKVQERVRVWRIKNVPFWMSDWVNDFEWQCKIVILCYWVRKWMCHSVSD